jgi:hypothetical protein
MEHELIESECLPFRADTVAEARKSRLSAATPRPLGASSGFDWLELALEVPFDQLAPAEVQGVAQRSLAGERGGLVEELLASEQFLAFSPDTLAEAHNRGYRATSTGR